MQKAERHTLAAYVPITMEGGETHHMPINVLLPRGAVHVFLQHEISDTVMSPYTFPCN